MKMTMQRFVPIGLLCAMSAACAPEKVLSVQNYQATFMCDDNLPVRVRFAPFAAELESQGVTVAMTQQPAAKGYLYTGGGQTLRQQGHEATWIDGKGVAHRCRDAATQASGDANRAPRNE
jgi:hypothetical protein